MFSRLFDGHPDLIVYPVDISLLYAYFPCFAYRPDATEGELTERIITVIKKCLFDVQESEGSSDLVDVNRFSDLLLHSLSGRNLRKRGDVIIAVADAWCSYKGMPNNERPFLFKETSQSVFFNELKAELPGLKMISLIRDPRDNYAALKAGVGKHYSKLGEGERETLASLLNRARMDLLSAEENQDQFPEDFMAIRFEDLIANPSEVMKHIAEFVGIRFVESLLVPTAIGRKYEGNSYDGKKFDGMSAENIGKWEHRISDKEAMIIEYWLGDVMGRWGYQKCFSRAQAQSAFAEFYNWYNCNYFFSDRFK
jgi:hypothetical protein